MSDIIDFFSNIFEKDLWPARWNCGQWSDFHGWLYIISDLLIWAAYFTIPIIIIRYIYVKQKNVRFFKAYFWFAAFILACGFTHLLDAIMFWLPVYRLNAMLRFSTALISWLTIYHLIKMLPIAFSLKSSDELQEEVNSKEKLLTQLNESHSKLLKQNEFIEKIIDSTTDYINVFDLQLNILSTNDSTINYLMKKEVEIVNKNFDELFPEAINNAYHQCLVAATKGELIKNRISEASNRLYYETSFIPLYQSNIQYAVLVISRDVSETIAREKKLEELNALLELKNGKLLQSNSELEQFTYILSHDLQEPLRKILMLSSMIQDPDIALDEQISFLSKIETTVSKMSQLIRDVLEYSRVQDKQDAWTDVSLNEVVESIISDMELVIAKKNVSITLSNLPTIKGIKYQITEVFLNLINNSIKYNNQLIPKIDITCAIVKHQGENFFEIKLQDNGIGFNEEYKESIFEPFKRLHSQNEYEGTGIGLALVKKIVENHKGKVYAESKPHEGSIFTLLFAMS